MPSTSPPSTSSSARPRVSVLLPAYNVGPLLFAALDSLLAQDMEDFEAVVVDDGSTDDTRMVLARYAWQDRRIRPVYIPHGGIVSALSAGLEAARAPYIARMDGDDVCTPERLALQADHLDAHPGTGLVSCLVEFGGDRRANEGYALYVDWANSLVGSRDIRLNRFVESPLPHPSVMYRRELVDRFGGYRNGDFPEDYELWLRWMDKGVVMDKLSRTLLRWNDRPGRLSRTDPRYAPDAFYGIKAGYLAAWLERNNPHHPEVVVAGAGRTSRKRAELLAEHGVCITSYLDVDPDKIGHRIQGRPVLHRDQVQGPDACFVLSYVASRGAREEIGAFLASRGFELGTSWLPAA